jgi:hypothetical protein
MTAEYDGARTGAIGRGGPLNKIFLFLNKFKHLGSIIGTHRDGSIQDKEDDVGRSPQLRREPEMLPPGLQEGAEMDTAQEIKFSDLQRIQYIEGKVHEVSLILKLNIETLEQLGKHYSLIMKHPNLPSEIPAKCQHDMGEFASYVGGARKDLQLQLSRTETLSRLLTEQKTFVSKH